jgi:hypothetical protein
MADTVKIIPILLTTLAFAGCASAPDDSQSQQAGANSAANGMDIWRNGPPSRPYNVIATVSREGADNSATYADEENFIAAEAAKQNADGIIILDTVMVVSRVNIMDGRAVMAPKVDAQLIKYQ